MTTVDNFGTWLDLGTVTPNWYDWVIFPVVSLPSLELYNLVDNTFSQFKIQTTGGNENEIVSYCWIRQILENETYYEDSKWIKYKPSNTMKLEQIIFPLEFTGNTKVRRIFQIQRRSRWGKPDYWLYQEPDYQVNLQQLLLDPVRIKEIYGRINYLPPDVIAQIAQQTGEKINSINIPQIPPSLL